MQPEKPAADYLGGGSIDDARSVEERMARPRTTLTWWEKTTWTVCTSAAEIGATTLKGRWGVAVAPLGRRRAGGAVSRTVRVYNLY